MSEKGVNNYVQMCGGLVMLILSQFSLIPHENEIIWSQ